MTRLTVLALVVALSAPAVAQIRGSINTDAPTVENSITLSDGSKLGVRYKAARFGEGRWQAILEQTDRHEAFNARAAASPAGSVTTTATVTASNREIAAGTYDLYFTVHERAGWLLNLKKQGDDAAEPLVWRLALQETDHASKRLSLMLLPGDESNSATFRIAFGSQYVAVPLTIGAVEKGGEDKQGGN